MPGSVNAEWSPEVERGASNTPAGERSGTNLLAFILLSTRWLGGRNPTWPWRAQGRRHMLRPLSSVVGIHFWCALGGPAKTVAAVTVAGSCDEGGRHGPTGVPPVLVRVCRSRRLGARDFGRKGQRGAAAHEERHPLVSVRWRGRLDCRGGPLELEVRQRNASRHAFPGGLGPP